MKPLDKKLYEKVVEEAKRSFRVYPSAYASGWIVRRYKELGGTYEDDEKKGITPLSRWYKEKWINVCKLPQLVPCGREKSNWEDYPYCRPSKRINKDTPTTAFELSNQEIKKRCSQKKLNPKKKSA